MYLRFLLLCLLALFASAQLTGEKRRVGLRYMVAEDDAPYNYGARNGGRNQVNSLRGRYGKRAESKWNRDY